MQKPTTDGWDRAAREADPTLWLADGVPMYFRPIQPGEFRMGSRGEDGNEEPVHLVRITHEFYLGTFPVTQKQFAVWTKETINKHENHFPDKPRHPAENMDWNEATAFCEWLNERFSSQLPQGFRAALPTEAQWEYACRAGTESKYYTGDGSAELTLAGWIDEDWESGSTHPVGAKQPNEWGLYDMHGNVWEWCYDAWDADAYKARIDDVADPMLDPSDVGKLVPFRVFHGGSWHDAARDCRSTFRNRWGPDFRLTFLGFRVRLVPGSVAGSGAAGRRGLTVGDVAMFAGWALVFVRSPLAVEQSISKPDSSDKVRGLSLRERNQSVRGAKDDHRASIAADLVRWGS